MRVRRAVNYAVDHDALNLDAYGEDGGLPTCQIVPPGVPGYRRYCPYARVAADGTIGPPDLRRARQLVRDSGTAGMHVTVWRPKLATNRVLVATLRQLGYRVTDHHVTQPFPVYQAAISDPRQHAQIGWAPTWIADFASPTVWVRDLFSCAAKNLARFCDPVLDREMARAGAVSDPRSRARAGRRSSASWSTGPRSSGPRRRSRTTWSRSASATSGTARSGACCSASSGCGSGTGSPRGKPGPAVRQGSVPAQTANGRAVNGTAVKLLIRSFQLRPSIQVALTVTATLVELVRTPPPMASVESGHVTVASAWPKGGSGKSKPSFSTV